MNSFRRNRNGIHRRGAILVCALVVLGLVVLITLQSVQTNFVLHRADREASKIQQAREVLLLGKAALRKERLAIQALEEEDPVLPESFSWRVEVYKGEFGQIVAERLPSQEVANGQSSLPSYRLKVTFPVDAPDQVTVSEQVKWTES